MVCLVLSGITAFPLETELRLVRDFLVFNDSLVEDGLEGWLIKIHEGLSETNTKYPFIAYGTDWLGFAHLVIAVAFLGPLKDPIRNVWVVEFGMIACCLVIPFALVAGEFRGIPLGWRLVDCLFGVFGIVPLWYCRKLIRELEKPAA